MKNNCEPPVFEAIFAFTLHTYSKAGPNLTCRVTTERIQLRAEYHLRPSFPLAGGVTLRPELRNLKGAEHFESG